MSLVKNAISSLLNPFIESYVTANWRNRSKSGANVDPETVLTVSAVMQAARAICVDTASMPTHLYRRLPGGGKERATDHSLYRMLHLQPNPRMSIVDYKIAKRMSELFYGNSYSLKQYDEDGDLIALWPLLPQHITFSVDPETGGLVYSSFNASGEEHQFQPGEILHRRGLSRDGVTGLSVITYATDSLGLAMTQQDEVGAFFKNGSRFGGFIAHPSTLSDKASQHLKDDLANNTRGSDNAWKWRVIEEGMQVVEVGVAPKDAQLLESRQWSNIEVCQWFDVPPWRLHILENGLSYASIEQQFIAYSVFNLHQWYYGDDMTWTINLLSEKEQEEYFFETDPKELLQGDTKSLYDALAIADDHGWLNTDEVREILNRNPLPDGSGKVYHRRLDSMGELNPAAPPAE